MWSLVFFLPCTWIFVFQSLNTILLCTCKLKPQKILLNNFQSFHFLLFCLFVCFFRVIFKMKIWYNFCDVSRSQLTCVLHRKWFSSVIWPVTGAGFTDNNQKYFLYLLKQYHICLLLPHIAQHLSGHTCLEKEISLLSSEVLTVHMVMFKSPLLPIVNITHYISLPLGYLPVLFSTCMAEDTFYIKQCNISTI